MCQPQTTTGIRWSLHPRFRPKKCNAPLEENVADEVSGFSSVV